MNNINASSLFHFTKKFDTLKLIIKNGLRYSYAYEKYPKEIISAYLNPFYSKNICKANGVGIPMISFCDIPITRAEQHIKKYGRYMIGFNKDNFTYALRNVINPVIYVHSPNLRDAISQFGKEYAKCFCEILDKITTKELDNKNKRKNNPYEYKKDLDLLIKTRFFSNFLIGLVKPIKDKNNYYYNEREWRTFIPINKYSNIDWIFDISQKEFNEKVNDWNQEINSSEEFFIKIPEDCIEKYVTHIVVYNENELNELIDFIMTEKHILGYDNYSEKSRLKLISKLSSFERIEKDY